MPEEQKEELIGGKPEEGIEELKKKIGMAWFVLILAAIFSIITFIAAPIHISMLIFIIIYLPVIVYVLILKWIKRGLPAIIFSLSVWLNVVIIIIPVFAGLTALDLSNFSEEFQENPKIIALADDEIISAIQINDLSFDLNTAKNNIKALDKEELSTLNKEVSRNKVKDRIVFVIKEELFEDIRQVDISGTEIVLTKEQAMEIIRAGSSGGDTAKELGLRVSLFDDYGKSAGAFVFILLLEETLEKNGPEFFVRELKKENIMIYPERFSVNLLIKIIPENILSQAGFLPELPGGQTKVVNTLNGKP